MNNARIWCVVRPTVGIPLIIGGAAIGSLAIHLAVLTTTDWFAQSFQRGNTAASAALTTENKVAARVSEGTPVMTGQEATLVMPDGSTVKVKFEMPASDGGQTTLASVTLPTN